MPQCRGICVNGNRCRRIVANGEYCYDHEHQNRGGGGRRPIRGPSHVIVINPKTQRTIHKYAPDGSYELAPYYQRLVNAGVPLDEMSEHDSASSLNSSDDEKHDFVAPLPDAFRPAAPPAGMAMVSRQNPQVSAVPVRELPFDIIEGIRKLGLSDDPSYKDLVIPSEDDIIKVFGIDPKVCRIQQHRPVVQMNENKIEKEFGSHWREYLDGFVPTERLGQGAFGTVLKLEKQGQKPRAIKLQVLNFDKGGSFDHEVNLFQYVSDNTNLSPKMYKAKAYTNIKTGRTIGFIIMDVISSTVGDLIQNPNLDEYVFKWLFTNIAILLIKMCKHDIVHGDLHWENLAYTIDDAGNCSLKIIDWGLGEKRKCIPCLEVMRFIHFTIRYTNDNAIDHRNESIILYNLEKMWDLFKCDKIAPFQKRTEEWWETLFWKTRRQYGLRDI